MTRTLVLGSNRGIGLELCRQLQQRGEEIIATCRRSSPELEALAGIYIHRDVDCTDVDSLRALARELGSQRVDSLVVVAGILRNTPFDDLDVELVREQFEVNAIAPLLAVHTLVDCLKPGAKIGLITSRMGSMADNTSGGSYGYRMSKAALNMAGRSLAHDLKEREIAVGLLHPGWVRTEMTKDTGNIDVSESVTGLIERLDALNLENSGSFWHQNGDALPW